MDFSKLFPDFGPTVDALAVTYPIIDKLQEYYAIFGALHLVGLALLGGCVILLNLRMLGVGLTDEAPSAIEKNLRPWLIAGACIVIGTGVFIGILNASKLFYSPAFFAKMVAMLAALIFTFGVTASLAKNEGVISKGAKITAAIASVIWLYSMGVFSLTSGIAPGVFHMITAAFVILMLFGQNRTKLVTVAVIALLTIVDVIVTYGFIGVDNDTLKFLEVTKYFTVAGGLFITGAILFDIFKGVRADAASPLARLIALFSILAWVTVAAGGRWIGFS